MFKFESAALYRCRVLRQPASVLPLLLLAFANPVCAEPARVALSTGVSYADNIGQREAARAQDELTALIGMEFAKKLSGSRLRADVAGGAVWATYFNDVYDDAGTGWLNLDAGYVFSPRVEWRLSDNVSQVKEDRTAADSPDNSVMLNILRTGPVITTRWSERQATEWSLQFIDVTFDGDLTESQRLRGEIDHLVNLSDDWVSGLRLVSEAADIDEPNDPTTRSNSLYFLLGKKMRKLEWSTRLGYTQFERREDDQPDFEDEGFTGSFELIYRPLNNLDVNLRMNRKLTDSVSDQVLENFEDFRRTNVLDTVVADAINLRLTYRLNQRDRFNLSATNIRDAYQNQNFDEDTQIVRASWEHLHTERLRSQISYNHRTLEFSDLDGENRNTSYRYDLVYRLLHNLDINGWIYSADGKLDNGKESFDDLGGGLTVIWRPRQALN